MSRVRDGNAQSRGAYKASDKSDRAECRVREARRRAGCRGPFTLGPDSGERVNVHRMDKIITVTSKGTQTHRHRMGVAFFLACSDSAPICLGRVGGCGAERSTPHAPKNICARGGSFPYLDTIETSLF